MKTKILTLVAATCLMAASVRATTMTFVTPVGATLNALPVEAQATFVTGADLLQITILNTIFNPTSVIQNVSGLGFTLSSGQTSGVLANSSGLFRTVNSN